MASKKQRNRALKRRKQLVREDDLSPGIAAGLTQGASAKEALELHPVQSTSGIEVVKHMGQAGNVEGTRVPLPRFVAAEDADSVWYDEPTGRIQKNVVMTFRRETVQAIQAGMICLRCLEPQTTAFPPDELARHLPGCTYPIRDRQIIDFAHEFEGDKHLGPTKPISEYLEDMELEREKRAFRRRLEEGASRMTGLRHAS